MNAALALLAWLLLPLIGIAVWRIPFVRGLDLPGRVAIAGAAGALVTAVVMFAMSVAGLHWTRTALFALFAVIAALSVEWRRSARVRAVRGGAALHWVFAILLLYGALDARISSGDLHYFWGPKAVRFYRAASIDTGFLADRAFYSMHPDYPPLLPLLYAWSNVLSQTFSWWAAVVTAPLLLLAAGAVVRSLTGDALGALLVVATMAQAMVIGYAAGAADPLLVFFEIIALAALMFVEEPRAQIALAALGLAGAAWTKIEGSTFLIAVVVALILVKRWRAAVAAVPALVLVVAWTLFIAVAGAVDMYAAAGRYPIYIHSIPKTLALLAAHGSYDVFWLPWVAPLVLIVTGDVRRAAFPLLVCALTLGAAVYFYIHAEDPTWWIASSAPRVLMTPLAALDLAAIAASTRSRTSAAGEPLAAS